MAQPAKAKVKVAAAPATVTITYNSVDNTWKASGDVSIPKSGMVKFDLDPSGCPPCNILCTPTTAGGDLPITGGGFTIGVGSGVGSGKPGGKK